MMLKTLLLRLAPLFFATPTFAAKISPAPYDYFISIGIGSSWTNPNSTQNIALQPDIINTYVSQHPSNTNALINGEIFLGLQSHFFPKVQGQVGLSFYASSPKKLNGYIQVGGDPSFQNYSDQYQINHEHIALKSNWIFENSYAIDPYVSGSIGIGFNRSYGYSITPLIFQALTFPAFQTNTEVALSYTLGAGIQRSLSQHITVGIGYQFVSWGESHLSPASGQTSSKGLGLSNLYTQGIELHLNYSL